MTPEEVYSHVVSIDGWFDLANIQGFHKLKDTLPEKPLIFECGTYLGRSAWAFHLLWPESHIYTCDPYNRPVDPVASDWQIHFYNMPGIEVPWEKPIDLLFIDDSHLYSDIKANFNKFMPFVKEGGYIVFHDYHFEGGGADGVKEFVDELGGCTIDSTGEYGLAIWKKETKDDGQQKD